MDSGWENLWEGEFNPETVPRGAVESAITRVLDYIYTGHGRNYRIVASLRGLVPEGVGPGQGILFTENAESEERVGDAYKSGMGDRAIDAFQSRPGVGGEDIRRDGGTVAMDGRAGGVDGGGGNREGESRENGEEFGKGERGVVDLVQALLGFVR